MNSFCSIALSGLATIPLALSPAFAAESPDPAALYARHCAQCHGANLQGGNAGSLIDGIWNFGAGGGSIQRNIKHGITSVGMPAYEATLDDREIKELTQYIESKGGEGGAVKPPPPTHVQTIHYEVDVAVWAEGLEVPWAVDFLDADTALITERPGRLRVVKDGKLLPDAVAGTPEVLNEGQGGLMDVAVDPDYAENGWIYLAYSHAIQEEGSDKIPAMTRIVRGKLKDNAWVDQEVIFEAPHEMYKLTRHHYGCRIVFDPAGNLYFSIGERGFQDDAQDISLPNGKVHRIHRDGTIPDDNPFVGKEGAMASIFSYGNRNPQGLAVHPVTGALWETEHGPMGGDEVNIIESGKNYGWPVICHGRNYNGQPISDEVAHEGMEQPILYWNPSIAACGLDFYKGDLFAKWNNQLLAGALRYEEVRLLTVVDNRVLHEEVILKNAARVRDVTTGPDGAIYVTLNGPDVVLRMTPSGERKY